MSDCANTSWVEHEQIPCEKGLECSCKKKIVCVFDAFFLLATANLTKITFVEWRPSIQTGKARRGAKFHNRGAEAARDGARGAREEGGLRGSYMHDFLKAVKTPNCMLETKKTNNYLFPLCNATMKAYSCCVPYSKTGLHCTHWPCILHTYTYVRWNLFDNCITPIIYVKILNYVGTVILHVKMLI